MKERWEQKIMEHSPANGCARRDDLIAFLYGESSERETLAFKSHLNECASCRSELSAFAGVRESVGQWRQQVLGAFEAETANASSAFATLSHARRRSALAALREFFSLSPAWMQAATALAAIAFIALMVAAVTHFSRPQSQSASAPTTVQPGYTQKQVDEMIANALREEREAASANQAGTAEAQNQNIASTAPNSPANRESRIIRASAQKQVYVAVSKKRSARPLTPQEFNEIVQGNQLTASNDEERLPRLSDLLRDTSGSN
ncbi:MAG TPA: zf-HC2 domain-containing protein [Pyrinomonadaceae bacterium]|nr:zf-HC2 domain-containing protein [Pyrinomonadaceae bacterium]